MKNVLKSNVNNIVIDFRKHVFFPKDVVGSESISSFSSEKLEQNKVRMARIDKTFVESISPLYGSYRKAVEKVYEIFMSITPAINIETDVSINVEVDSEGKKNAYVKYAHGKNTVYKTALAKKGDWLHNTLYRVLPLSFLSSNLRDLRNIRIKTLSVDELLLQFGVKFVYEGESVFSIRDGLTRTPDIKLCDLRIEGSPHLDGDVDGYSVREIVSAFKHIMFKDVEKTIALRRAQRKGVPARFWPYYTGGNGFDSASAIELLRDHPDNKFDLNRPVGESDYDSCGCWGLSMDHVRVAWLSSSLGRKKSYFYNICEAYLRTTQLTYNGSLYGHREYRFPKRAMSASNCLRYIIEKQGPGAYGNSGIDPISEVYRLAEVYGVNITGIPTKNLRELVYLSDTLAYPINKAVLEAAQYTVVGNRAFNNGLFVVAHLFGRDKKGIKTYLKKNSIELKNGVLDEKVMYGIRDIPSFAAAIRNDINNAQYVRYYRTLHRKGIIDITANDIMVMSVRATYIDVVDTDTAVACYNMGVSQRNFSMIQKRVSEWRLKNPTGMATVLPTTSVCEGAYTVRVLPRSDVRGYFLGDFTGCCQGVGDTGEACAISGMEDVDKGFLVVEKKGHIKAQAWIWRDGGTIVLDSVEDVDLCYSSVGLVAKVLKTWAEKMVADKSAECDHITIGKTSHGIGMKILERVGIFDRTEYHHRPHDYRGYMDGQTQYTLVKNTL